MDATFGFLLFDNLEELDLVGPWEMINVWRKEYQGPKSVFTVSQQGGLITCVNGLRIASDYSFHNCPKLDYLLIPGGMGTRLEVNNEILIQFIRQQAQHCRNLISVCTGSFLLQAADLLANHQVTTHWQSLDRLKQFPELKVKEERFVKDGKIWSAAGISAGMDMALAFIADVAGEDIAGKVQLKTEYFPNQKTYLDLNQVDHLPLYLKK
jgi:transcriptional regulator GlxA family with amidase domain